MLGGYIPLSWYWVHCVLFGSPGGGETLVTSCLGSQVCGKIGLEALVPLAPRGSSVTKIIALLPKVWIEVCKGRCDGPTVQETLTPVK